ncbi:MAG: TIGR02757 family protein [Acidobacteriota bacterium]
MRHPVGQSLLHERLDALVATFDVSTIEPDPLQLVLRYDDPLDQEVAGIVAAAFAYGRADIIVANIGVVLTRMTPSPYRYLASFDRKEAMRRFAGFAHRFHKTPELVAFLERIAAAIRAHGSLGALFRECYEEGDADIGPSLARFVAVLRCHPERSEGPVWVGGAQEPPTRAARPHRSLAHARDDKAISYLLSSPQDGSACKRMNLFLRWMVRRTSPDLGLWDFVDPAKLIVPLDTHVHRIATFLGLNRRKTADWKAARALTDRLARFDRSDPVRYDFALCRLGILDLCSRKKKKENCDVCQLRDVCRFPLT